ncbi:MAG: SpoIIE family protein phosphatase [Leptospiraceae bacterium]|nr:SpoIIE family protein phosphatase [Leptospiraceae bacterium]
MYLRLNQNTKAKEYLREAHDSYMKMEAKAKAEYLEKSYPNFIQKEVNKLKLDITQTKTISQTQTYTHTHSTDSISGTGSTLTSSFDVSTILKTSQVLSGEIELKNLLKKIMKISIENAGAQRGVLLLLNDETDSFHVQAEGDSNEEYNIMQSIPLEKCTTILPVSLINYVRKSKESIVLDDASSSNLFKNDPYIVVNNSKSILCAPLKAKRKVNGIIFLENNLTTSVFTKGNLEIIKVITGQAAVSVENAFLYNNLEEKVKARTQDLQEALQEVTELKKRQDGDYYLTSLLLEPLSKNLANSEKVKIDFFLKQKKQFSFKNNTKEIGGDVNISHSIKLNGKDYTIFLNADAMGKSSQGAGGVLVFGTAFDVIIERTKKGAHISPIKWLGSAYQELHQVFLSFSGLMLMSMVLGIVEDETGLTYFMNTEHPQTVLYRNGKANFIEKKFTHYKLGSGLEEFNTDKKLIHKVQLERGDMLLMGSDGKDDVRINGVINEDETLFLKHVEDGKGDLNEIASLIINTGEITDDFSMLRVEYK